MSSRKEPDIAFSRRAYHSVLRCAIVTGVLFGVAACSGPGLESRPTAPPLSVSNTAPSTGAVAEQSDRAQSLMPV
ncbi:hypothetical protein ODZ83_03040 [Acaricomes phytoseiuli]|uniref:hypothetical protein n=1 Tax=Acaricomes phytoseiuli TaxID=291968 RepID=UPI000363745E|nr:hypothetical protein [Acaricomes phytoseiuli]MCW1249176.1 hypothetical protein [Acaricomes phytoseiuli]